MHLKLYTVKEHAPSFPPSMSSSLLLSVPHSGAVWRQYCFVVKVFGGCLHLCMSHLLLELENAVLDTVSTASQTKQMNEGSPSKPPR